MTTPSRTKGFFQNIVRKFGYQLLRRDSFDLLMIERENTKILTEETAANLARANSKVQYSVAEAVRLSSQLAEVLSDSARERDESTAKLTDAFKVIDADKEKIELQLHHIASMERDIDTQRLMREKLEKKVGALASTLKARDKSLADRDKSLAARDKSLAVRDESLASANTQLAARDKSLAVRDESLASANTQLAALNSELAALRDQPPPPVIPIPPDGVAGVDADLLYIKRAAIAHMLDLDSDLAELKASAGIDKEQIDGMLLNVLNPQGGTILHLFRELASTVANCGHPELAKRLYKRFIDAKQDDAMGHSYYMQCCMLAPESTNQSLYTEHKVWAERHEDLSYKDRQHANSPDPERLLKVGLICHFFGASTGEPTLSPLIEAMSKSKFEVICYDDGSGDGALYSAARYFRHTRDLSDEELAATIEADKIDVLVEMNGHCIGNRYGAIMRRPAPIQVNWGNYPSTTGLRTMDYALTDGISVLESEEKYFTESIYRIPSNSLGAGYKDMDFPDPAPAPVVKNGYITFGNFGAIHKTNPTTIALWASVLKAVPNSKLIFKSEGLGHELTRNAILGQFEYNGIDPDRLILSSYSPYAEMLKQYGDVDIALDCFPATGGSTLSEAMWQCVPAVTLTGDRWISRIGTSMLNRMGFPQWAAKSPEEFIEIAVGLANDRDSLCRFRKELRTLIASSAYANPELSAREMGNAYREMWRRWCSQTVGATRKRQVRRRAGRRPARQSAGKTG